MKLSNQVAIVTGAGRNIGEEISKTLAAEGAKVAVVDLDKGRGDRVSAEITKAGGEAAAFVADMAAEADIARVVAAVLARNPDLDAARAAWRSGTREAPLRRVGDPLGP